MKKEKRTQNNKKGNTINKTKQKTSKKTITTDKQK